MDQSKQLELIAKKKARTLHVHFPCKISDTREVEKLFFGDFKIKLPRQTSRNCHVIFSNREEAAENLAAAKGKLIDGKSVKVRRLSSMVSTTKFKKCRKKIIVPPPKPDLKVTRTIFATNIKCGTKINEIKEVFPGCVSVVLLKPYKNNLRCAAIKMENLQIAANYLSGKNEWPSLKGTKLILKPDIRKKRKTKLLKIYN